ncbi:MAG: CRTAC1 family protein, partial [Gammaproteobacteria bacterium]
AELEELDLEVAIAPPGAPADEILPQLESQRVTASSVEVTAPAGITVSSVPLATAETTEGKWFTRRSGHELGISQPYQVSIRKWTEPWSVMHGTAAGDVHNDGWEDIVTAPELGIYLYANIDGQYVSQQIDVEGLYDLYVQNVALIDMNDDGWLDLFYSTYRNGNYLIYNDQGRFSDANQVRLPNQPEAWATLATAFADLDLDGDLDITLGNWTLGPHRQREMKGRQSSRNVILWNQGGEFEIEELPGEPGETITALVTDLNGDKNPDLLLSNDFEVPDMVYLGDGQGGMQMVLKEDGLIATTTRFTMSAVPADLNNDLVDELYMGNISGTDNSPMRKFGDICQEAERSPQYAECVAIRADQENLNNSIARRDPFLCEQITDRSLADQCIGQNIFLDTWPKMQRENCSLLRNRLDAHADICDEFFRVKNELAGTAFDRFVPQARDRANVLLTFDGSKWTDHAIDWGLDESGWVWTAQFADLNHDEYLDMYLGTGMFFQQRTIARESNMFFLNTADDTFADHTEEAGLELYAETASFVFTDSDNDGDMDIVALEAIGPVWHFENNEASGNSLLLHLEDGLGNRDGIGSRITIFYGDRSQVRQINASGAFHAFNSYTAHFGIAQHDTVDRVEVQWPTGETTTIDGPFPAGHRYTISRR